MLTFGPGTFCNSTANALSYVNVFGIPSCAPIPGRSPAPAAVSYPIEIASGAVEDEPAPMAIPFKPLTVIIGENGTGNNMHELQELLVTEFNDFKKIIDIFIENYTSC